MNDEKTRRKPIRLSEKEWEIMKLLWDHGPMAARDVYEKVPASQKWAYKTVKTMLARLVKKGALVYDQVGNSYLYRAAHTRAEMVREATASFIRRVFDGALTPFLAHFVEHVSHEELQVIKAELARLERAKSKRRRG